MKTNNITNLTCVKCGSRYNEQEVEYTCPSCGPQGVLRVNYDYERIASRFTRELLSQRHEWNHWRYIELLPVNDRTYIPPLQVGWTPLYPAPRLSKQLGIGALYIKDDTGNPTGSLKDRATSVCIARCVEQGNNIIACASTGNAGTSCAGFAASVGIPSYVFIPKKAPKAKAAQLFLYSATTFAVDGSYDDAFALCQEACHQFGWYNRNTAVNPYTIEGKKTVAMEICEQLNWQVPDIVIVAVGDGCIIGGVWKGFRDLHKVGLIDRLPMLIAAQAEGSQAIKRALESDGIVRPLPANTIADSISVSMPSNGIMAIESIRNSSGYAVAVSDQQILGAMRELGRSTGIFAEPAAAATLAVLKKITSAGTDLSQKRVVLAITGSGFKDIDSTIKAGSEPVHVKPDMNELRKVLSINRGRLTQV